MLLITSSYEAGALLLADRTAQHTVTAPADVATESRQDSPAACFCSSVFLLTPSLPHSLTHPFCMLPALSCRETEAKTMGLRKICERRIFN